MSEILEKIKAKKEQYRVRYEALQEAIGLTLSNYGDQVRFEGGSYSVQEAYAIAQRLRRKFTSPIPDITLKKVKLKSLVLNASSERIAGFAVGRSASSNCRVYQEFKNSRSYYFHTIVRGGGLVIGPQNPQDRVNAATLAMMYSKHYTKLGSSGKISYAKNIRSLGGGTFLFIDRQEINIDYYDNPLYLDLGLPDLTFKKPPLKKGYMITPGPSNVRALLGKTYRRADLAKLQNLLPSCWKTLAELKN